MRSHARVVIIGGGAVGASILYHLAKAGITDTEVLVVWSELEAKEEILARAPDAAFETDHYAGWGAFLVRLAVVDPDDLADWLEEAYRLRAPASALRALDERST